MPDEFDPTMITVSTAGLSVDQLEGMALATGDMLSGPVPPGLEPVQEFWQGVSAALFAERRRRAVP